MTTWRVWLPDGTTRDVPATSVSAEHGALLFFGANDPGLGYTPAFLILAPGEWRRVEVWRA